MSLGKNFQSTMTVGVDVIPQGRKSIIGLSASYSQYLTQHFSKVEYQELHKEMVGQKGWTKERQEIEVTKKRAEILAKFIEEALGNYVAKNNGQRPSQIVIYRDGVGGPSYHPKCLDMEIPMIMHLVENFAPNYKPKVLYIFVDQKKTIRFFEKINGHHINPGPGTLVDQGVVENDESSLFDFYMVPNENPTSACAKPVHYQVVVNTTGLNKQEIEDFTY